MSEQKKDITIRTVSNGWMVFRDGASAHQIYIFRDIDTLMLHIRARLEGDFT